MSLIKKTIFPVIQSTAFVYAILAVIWFFVLDDKETLAYARGSTLSRIMPTFEYFVDFTEKKVPFDAKQWEAYKFYFERASAMMPLRADVYGLLGYTYYQIGKTDKAADAYLKGVKLLPHFFWYRYNLGVIYYKQGKYDEAAESFNNGLGLKLDETINYIYKARMYAPVLLALPNHQKRVIFGLQQSYDELYLFMVQCYLKSEDNDKLFKLSAYVINQNIDRNGIFYYYAGFAKYQLKEYAEALAFFDKSIKINPNFPEAFYYLGLATKESGNEQLARGFLQKSVDLYQQRGPFLANIEEHMDLKVFW